MPLDFLTLMTVMAANLFMISAAFKLARGMLGAFTDQYPSFRTPHPVNLAAAVAINVSLVLGTVARANGAHYAAKTAGRGRLVAAD